MQLGHEIALREAIGSLHLTCRKRVVRGDEPAVQRRILKEWRVSGVWTKEKEDDFFFLVFNAHCEGVVTIVVHDCGPSMFIQFALFFQTLCLDGEQE